MMAEIEVCDVCGSTDIRPFKCKVICLNCGAILKTCSDLLVRTDRTLIEVNRNGS